MRWMRYNKQMFCAGLLSLAALLFACNKESEMINRPVSGSNQIFYTLVGNNLYTYNANTVASPQTNVPITGLQPSEQLISMDIRPATGQLYALSNQSRIYAVDIQSGVANAISTAPFTPALSSSVTSINFNPTTDLIRLISDNGQAQLLDPTTGQVVTQEAVISTHLQAIAYANNTAGVTSTTMYAIDAQANKLYKQVSETSGLQVVGDLGVTLNQIASFDINPGGSVAMVLSKDENGKNVLYELDLNSGKARLTGKFPETINANALAMPTNGVTYAVSNQNFITITYAGEIATIITKPITGLPASENVLTMDIRPFNGQLFALTSNNKLYTVNMASGLFTSVASLSTPLNGQNFDMDFNPAKDIMHLISNTGQNVNITIQGVVTNNPAFSSSPTTAVASTTTFVGLAYTNSATATTTLPAYVMAHNPDALFSLNATSGLITFINKTGLTIENAAGFDITSVASSYRAFAVFSVGGVYNIYNVDLSSGSASVFLEIKTPINAFASGLRFNR